MRHAIGLGVVLLLVATGEALAAGNNGPPCRTVSWVRTGNMTTPREGHAATLLPSGTVLVTGGLYSSTAELYDPATGTWSATGSMSFGRNQHTMTLLPTGKVLVAGGDAGDSRTAELYDPDAGQWTTTGAMLLGREGGHTATLLPTGKVLVVGGRAPGSRDPLASAELYDPATGEWHPTGELPIARALHTATLLASGQVLVLGGLPISTASSAELYDPATGTWTPTAPTVAARVGHTATRLRSGAVLVAGGQDFSSGAPLCGGCDAELYDPAAGTWRRTGSMFAPRGGHTATLLSSGKVLVVGGDFSLGNHLANTELFDLDSETWSDAGCMITPRDEHTATLLRSGAVLVAGGSDDSSAELYGIIVSPAQVSLAPGASQSFTAKGGSGLGYVWSFVHNESGGTLTASGDYQAGPVGGATDVVQVVDSFANSATATVNVIRQSTLVSATGPQAKSMGCSTTGAASLPALGGVVLFLSGWRSLRVRRRKGAAMRHALGLGVSLLLLSAADAFAAGNAGCTASHWARTGNLTTPREDHAAVLLPSGKILVAGGFGGATAELYDPATGTWAPTGSMNIPRSFHTLTLLPTGKVLVVGGRSDADTRPAEFYDPDTGRWTTTGAIQDEVGRVLHTATLLPTGKVLVVGGLGFPPGPLDTAELYDPSSGEWHATGALSTPRLSHTATLLASGQVLAVGGSSTTGPPLASAELYDPPSGTWTLAAPMLVGRSDHTATRLRSDAVLVAGGVTTSSASMLEAELYEPASGTWHVTGSLPSTHVLGHTATLLPSGRVLVVGGVGSTGTEPFFINPFTELFDPQSGTWSNAGCALHPRSSHTATLLLSGAVLVAGGGDGSGDGSVSSAELYRIVVSPAQVSLAPGASQTFTARGGSDLGFVWSFVHNESGGTLTASGDYQAGPVGGVTDVVQVVDSFANSSMATVNVLRQQAAVAATAPQAKSVGCGTTAGAAVPGLGGVVLVLLGWTVRHRRRWSPATASGRVEDGVAPTWTAEAVDHVRKRR